MMNLEWRILLTIGIGMLIGSGVAFYWGYQLKTVGDSFSHIWILALGFAWVGSDVYQKAIPNRTNNSK